ncbi:MAG: hypothetical protein AAF639_41300, partial [Chloroflexota bacterium]
MEKILLLLEIEVLYHMTTEIRDAIQHPHSSFGTTRENLRKLLAQKALYAAGEVPLQLLNQIEAEKQALRRHYDEKYEAGYEIRGEDPLLRSEDNSIFSRFIEFLFEIPRALFGFLLAPLGVLLLRRQEIDYYDVSLPTKP